jgi:glycosyltransferase involved in cell wall biosynthesis
MDCRVALLLAVTRKWRLLILVDDFSTDGTLPVQLNKI